MAAKTKKTMLLMINTVLAYGSHIVAGSIVSEDVFLNPATLGLKDQKEIEDAKRMHVSLVNNLKATKKIMDYMEWPKKPGGDSVEDLKKYIVDLKKVSLFNLDTAKKIEIGDDKKKKLIGVGVAVGIMQDEYGKALKEIGKVEIKILKMTDGEDEKPPKKDSKKKTDK